MSLGKHFINDVEDPIERSLKCFLRLDHSLRLIESEKVLYRVQTRPKVILISGGGSGHEPAHAGYLGEGMLDVCVAGQIFSSPSASQVLAGLEALDASEGILMIVKNYTGDKLNFGLAAQRAKAKGIRVNLVFVGDDVAVKGNDLVGNRGLSGVVFVHKIAGALAATGATLDEVTDIAQKVADNIYTVGISLDKCSVPRRIDQQSLPSDKLEYGMGIHNEPGVRRDAIPHLTTTVENALSFLTTSSFTDELPVAVMINNLGGLSVLELNVIAGEVMNQLEAISLNIKRMMVGTFVTSLDGPGFSVTLLRLHPGFEELLNTKTTAPAWPNLEVANHGNVNGVFERTIVPSETSVVAETWSKLPVSSVLVENIMEAIVENVTRDEPKITKYDTIAGDGDCGETLLKGVNAVKELISSLTSSGSKDLDIITTFRFLSTTVETSMGGTSGALYAIYFNALANSLAANHIRHASSLPLKGLLAMSLSQALTELCKFTTARKGHKTLMDALIPFVETFAETMDFEKALGGAVEGMEGTQRLDAVLGRASYVGKESFEGGVPDPGAVGVVSVLRGVREGLGKEI